MILYRLKTTEDYEKKIKEYEGREEALLKRITEKDKTLVKMTLVYFILLLFI